MLFEYAMAKANRGEPEIAFCFTRQVNERGHKGDALTELDKAEVLKLRSRSMTYRTLSQNVTTGRNERERQKAQQKFDETPWVLWGGNDVDEVRDPAALVLPAAVAGDGGRGEDRRAERRDAL